MLSSACPVRQADSNVSQPLLNLLTLSLSSTFASGHLFSSLSDSLVPTPDGLTWTIPSESHTQLTAVVQSPLFIALGPLSRSLGRLIEAAGSSSTTDPSALTAVRNLGTTLERLVSRVQKGWASTPWSGISDDSSLSPATRSQTEPWTVLKSLLFSITLIHSSLLVIVSPRSGVIPTRLQLELAKQAVRILQKTYFVTLKFGSDGFSAWKGAWVGLLEVAGQDTREGVAGLMRELEPVSLGELSSRQCLASS
jgi:hypothetical protein